MKNKFTLYVLLTLFLVVGAMLGYAFFITAKDGPHPECGNEPIVGPCDYVGASLHTAGWISVPALCVWVTLIFLGLVWRLVRRKSKPSKLESLLLAMFSLPLIAGLLLLGYILIFYK